MPLPPASVLYANEVMIFRDGEAECLLHPSFVAGRIKGDLLWFVNMRAFDSDWNETMCRIRLKTMCGEWRLAGALAGLHPAAADVHHRAPIVWPWLHFWSGILFFFVFLPFFPSPPSCFSSVMGYNNLNKSHWLSLSSIVWAWQWWKGPGSSWGRLPLAEHKSKSVRRGKVWKSARFFFLCFDSVILSRAES